MSYASSWGDGFDFKDLGSMIGLHGFKPMKYHIESNIGLHGWNGLGKAQGTNALAGALIAGGMYAAPYLGASGASSAAAPAEGSASSGGMFSGLFGGGGASAPTAAVTTPSAPTSPPATDGGLLSGFSKYAEPLSKGMQIGQQAQGLMGGNQQVQAQPQQQRQAPDLSGFISAQAQQQASIDADRQRRLQQQQIAMQGLLGGRNGIA